VLISPFLHDGKVDVYVVSDKLQQISGTIHTRLLDFSGNVLLEQTNQVQIPQQSSVIYFTVQQTALSAKGDLRQSFLVFDLENGGKRISRNVLFFDVAHNLELPIAPAIQTTISQTGEEYSLTLKSEKLARSVYVSFGDLDVRTSDNYFDLLPAEPVTIRLTSSATLEQIKAAMKVTSLTEAFHP
jgi:beta-mannosidase